MVNANELRIGNKIIAGGLHGGKIMTVEQIGSKGSLSEARRVIVFKEHEVGEFAEDCFPIELSPEILEACGFNIVGNLASKEFISKYEFGLREIVIAKTVVILNNKVQIECKHLHQLQNLIYFLSDGTELPIDEKIFRKTEGKMA